MSIIRVFFGIGRLRWGFFLLLVMWAETAVAGNAKFYGTFDMTLSGTEPLPWTEVGRLRIGSNESRMREESYLHIPPDGNPVTNAWTEEDGEPVSQVITIAEDVITVDQREECRDTSGARLLCFTKHLEFTFLSGYGGAAVSGSMWSHEAYENQGLVTGSLTRVADDGGGGGGCFIGAAIARGF
ncbi:MAG: hypothetical protein SWE60_08395 [Thermodesulfobacteriota bacterium]|nr:hypothetical protein [Thermodesulfobacteriota bacterium]